MTDAGNHTFEYTYDENNRQTRNSTVANILTKLYSYDMDDRLDSDTYDANGNTVSAPLTMNH